MISEIGSKYKETRATLMERIRQGAIDILEAKATNHSCYFCLRSIDGKMIILVSGEKIHGQESESKYFIDDICYRNSKRFVNYNGILVSLS